MEMASMDEDGLDRWEQPQQTGTASTDGDGLLQPPRLPPLRRKLKAKLRQACQQLPESGARAERQTSSLQETIMTCLPALLVISTAGGCIPEHQHGLFLAGQELSRLSASVLGGWVNEAGDGAAMHGFGTHEEMGDIKCRSFSSWY